MGDLDAIEDEISLTNELPNLVENWTEKKEPKVWNNTGSAYNKKWRPNSMTILDPNKNVITVEDAMPGVKEGKPKTRDNGVVPYYAVVACDDIERLWPYTADFPENDRLQTASKTYLKFLSKKLNVPNVDYEEYFEQA